MQLNAVHHGWIGGLRRTGTKECLNYFRLLPSATIPFLMRMILRLVLINEVWWVCSETDTLLSPQIYKRSYSLPSQLEAKLQVQIFKDPTTTNHVNFYLLHLGKTILPCFFHQASLALPAKCFCSPRRLPSQRSVWDLRQELKEQSQRMFGSLQQPSWYYLNSVLLWIRHRFRNQRNLGFRLQYSV